MPAKKTEPKRIAEAWVEIKPRRAKLIEIKNGQLFIDGELFPHRFSNNYSIGLAGDKNEAYSIGLEIFVHEVALTDGGLLVLDGIPLTIHRRALYPKITAQGLGDFPPIRVDLILEADSIQSDFSIFPGKR